MAPSPPEELSVPRALSYSDVAFRVPGGSAEGVYNGIVSMQYTGCESLQMTWRKEGGADSGSMEHEEECPDEAGESEGGWRWGWGGGEGRRGWEWTCFCDVLSGRSSERDGRAFSDFECRGSQRIKSELYRLIVQ